jgi:hypothetical protein
MCKKVLPTIFIVIALALAIMMLILQQKAFPIIMHISGFFNVMIPVLAVGALIKYIVGCHAHCCCQKHEHEEGSCCHTHSAEENKK